MPVFVHLTAERNLRSIRRRGIAAARDAAGVPGVYAMPVTRNFYISHQWLRELRRGGSGPVFGVYFRVPKDERVRVGHYGRGHVEMAAAEAVALLMEAERRDPARARLQDERSRAVQRGRALPSSPEGFEVVVARPIAPSELLRIRALPQVVGWRYRPGSHDAPPCACICCEKGNYGIRKLERAVEEAEARGRPTRVTLLGREESSFRRVDRLRRDREKP
jgi:hypothetical protein